MKFLKFLKLFLICLGGIIGVCGVSMGIMYLTGFFNTTPVYPEQIAFAQNEYEVEGDFKMMITSPTEDVNQLEVTLSLEGVDYSKDDIVTDGVISIPKYVKIGEEFEVKIVKSLQSLNGQNVEWVNGGISKIVATSSNINARKIETQVFVDVPVYAINILTSISSEFDTQSLQSSFNVDSEFFAKAEFIPEKSMYQYSRDTQYGGETKYKSAFFSTTNNLEILESADVDLFVKKIKANTVANDIEIVARAFANTSTQLQAYESVSGFEDEDLAYTNLLAILQNSVEIEKAVSTSTTVNVKQLVVGGFVADVSSTVPAQYNHATKIYANKSVVQSNEYTLNAKIFANDNKTLLTNQIEMFGLVILKQTGTGYELAQIYQNDQNDADVAVVSRARKQASVLQQDATVFLPVKNTVDVNNSYWEITPLKENLNLHFALVLFDQNFEITEFSFSNQVLQEPKYVFDIQGVQIVSNQVYWTNPLVEEKSLYIYDGATASENIADEYDLKQHQIFVGENTYTQHKYFAYLEMNDGTLVNPQKGEQVLDSQDLSKFIVVGEGRIYNANISSGINVLLYELPEGVVKALYNTEELDGKIKVLFATVKTDFIGSVLKDSEGNIIVDRYSSNSNIGCQTMTFVTKKTLANVSGQVAVFDDSHFDQTQNLFAIKTNTTNAFAIKFDLQATQKDIFVRDYNEGKVSIDFYVNGEKDNSIFGLTFDADNTSVDVTVGEFVYGANDSGCRDISIKINYVRGNGNTVTTEIQNFYSSADPDKNCNRLQIYDGKINKIMFAGYEDDQFSTNLQTNPIVVSTNLEKDTNVNNGIFVAKVGSSYTIKLDDNDITSSLMDETTKQIKVVAYDKYLSPIEEDANNLYWELVSSDEDIIKVNNATKTISFVKASNDIVSLSVRTYKAAGEGNKVVECERKLWFNVQTGGKIVKVEKYVNDSYVDVYNNLSNRVEENNVELDKYLLLDSQKQYDDTSLEIEILGKAGNEISLNNLVKVYFGLETNDLHNSYEVFDLQNVLSWTRSDKNNFEDFITFKDLENNPVVLDANAQAGETESKNVKLGSFVIQKNFGKTGYVNLKISSDLGINIAVNITISPFVSASVTNTYSHENDGATSLTEGNISYKGVYAQKEIELQFEVNFDSKAQASDKHTVSKIICYVSDEFDNRIAIKEITSGGVSGKTFVSGKTDNIFEVKYTFDDLIANTKYKMTVVLDTSGENADMDYQKLAYDYFSDIYFYVNPNIQSSLVSGEDTDNDGYLDTMQIGAYENQLVKNILKTDSSIDDNIIDVSRILSSNSSDILFEKNTSNPYVYVKLVDDKGNEKNYADFVLNGNSLKIRDNMLLQGSQDVFVGVFFGTQDSDDLKIAIYKFVVTPSLKENIELKDKNNVNLKDSDGENLESKMKFVKYNNVLYLQLLAGKQFEFDDIAKCFNVVDENANILESAKINAEFELVYVNQTRYWNIVSPTISTNDTSSLIVDQLFVTLTIEGVGSVQFPVMITPQLDILVKYVEDDSQNNILANQDLYTNQSIEKLVEYDIYDIVPDGETTNIFANNTKTNGIAKIDDASYVFEILDGNGNAFATNNFASIDENGNLTVDAIGEDKYIIVVAKISGFSIAYRLKIQSSLKLEVFYPYVDNVDVDGTILTDRAEYVLFRNSDFGRKTLNLTEDFTQIIPAYSQSIEIATNKQNLTSRFMLLRYDSQTQKIVEQKDIENISISIKNIQNLAGTQDIASSLWGQYAVVENEENCTNLILSNLGSYKVILEVCTSQGAKNEYVVKVELSSKSYTLVDSVDGTISDITKMPELDENDIEIQSPVKGETTTKSIENIKLKMTSGSTSSDKTDDLGYLIVDNSGKIKIENKEIKCEYTANDINSQIIFFTKYGEVARRNIKVHSVTKVLQKSDDGTQVVDGESGYQIATSKTLTSGQIVDLNNLFVVAEKNDDETWSSVSNLEYQRLEFDKTADYLVGIEKDKFVLLPIKQGVSDILTLTVFAKIEDEDFVFEVELNIVSGFTSYKPTSLDPVVGTQTVSGKEHKISIFDDLFETSSIIDFEYMANIIKSNFATVNKDGQSADINYVLVYELQSGNDVLKDIKVENNCIVFGTNATANDKTVKIRFTLELEFEQYRFECTCYYQFVVIPDSSVTLSYPNIGGQQFESEKIYFEDSFNLSEKPLFGEDGQQRVSIVAEDGVGTLDIKVNYHVLQGQDAITVAPQTTENNDINTTYTFTFNDTASYALVEFDIFVSGLQRATYTLEVYKNFNSLYSVNVQTLYEKDGESEVFYLAEGRQDIFNGPQAFKFIVSNIPSLLSSTTTFEYFANTVSLGTFTLNASDLGQSKTVVLEYTSQLESLTKDNLRFKINGSAKYYTVADLASGENAYFTTDASGNVNFEIFNRLKVQYLGIDVTQYTEFLKDKIKLVGTDNSTLANFKLDYSGLGIQQDGSCNTQVSKTVKIVYQKEDNVLGSYYYKVKSDLQILNADDVIKITAGESIDKLMGVIGVVDHNKNSFVTYTDGNIVVSDVLKQKDLVLNLDFNTFEDLGNDVKFLYLDTKEKYESTMSAMTYSDKVLQTNDDNIVYDFEILANGAPNNGLYCELLFEWVYKISDNSNDDISFRQILKVEIYPNVQIELKNLDGSNNSAENPQKITNEMYQLNGTEYFYNLVLVDKNDMQNALVNAYKTNTSSTENIAYNLAYKTVDVDSTVAQIIISEQSKSLTVHKPKFSKKEIQVLISDDFGYSKTFFVQIEPETLINFVEISGGQIFENDTFVLKTGAETSDADHEITLSQTSFDNCLISYRLMSADGTRDLLGISNSNLVGVGTILRFNTLDSTVFSQTKTISCYLEITLKCQDENYIINTNVFALRQRYSSTVIDLSARDGVEFELKNKVSFLDNKLDTNIADPELFVENTLVVNDENVSELVVSAKLKSSTNSVVKTAVVSEQVLTDNKVSNTESYSSYIMMSEIFDEDLAESYDFYVTSANIMISQDKMLKLNIVSSTDGYEISVQLAGKDRSTTVGEFDYDFLVYDGTQYKIINLNQDNTSQILTGAYNNAMFGLVGYRQHESLPILSITKNSESGSYITRLQIDPNGFDGDTYTKEIIFTNLGELGGFDKKQIKVTQITFEENNPKNVTVVVNGKSEIKTVLSKNGIYYVDLTPNAKQTVSNANENWLLTQVDFESQIQICDDKRLEIVTVQNFNQTDLFDLNTEDITQNILNKKVDGGKVKFEISDGISIENVFAKLTFENVDMFVFPQDFESLGQKQYAFKLDVLGLSSQQITITDVVFLKQTLKNETSDKVSLQVYNTSKNITEDVILSSGEGCALNVSQGLWDVVYDKQSAKTVDIEFAGGQKLSVKLDANGKQTFSLLKNNIDIKGIALEDKTYEDQFVSVEFYDDSVGFKVQGANSGSISFEITRTRNNVEKTVNVSVSLYSYAYTYYVGLTNLFGQIPTSGDRYTIKCISKSNSYTEGITIFVPYAVDGKKYAEIQTLTLGEIVTFVADGTNKIESDTLNYDSKEQYDEKAGNLKYTNIQKYYLAKYHGAYYQLNPSFKLTPYFYDINIDNVSNKESNWIIISDYTQMKDQNDNISYTIDMKNWADGIRFEDINGKIIKDNNLKDITLADAIQKLNCTVTATDQTAGGSGNAEIDQSLNIIIKNVNDISVYHVTLNIQVSLGGNDKSENSQWLDIGTVTLIFNSKNQYQIPFNSRFVIANQNKTSDKTVDTFRFVGYGDNDLQSGENLSFSASRLFNDQEVLDMSQVRTIVKEQNDNKVYLLENGQYYQLAYNQDDNTKIIVVAKAQEIAASERSLHIYGLTNGSSITIKAKQSKNDEDYVYATYRNTDQEVFYGKILLSDLQWKSADDQDIQNLAIGKNSIFDYNVFEIDKTYADKCCVPLSYIDLDNFDQNGTKFSQIVAYYNADSFSGGETQLISNENFYYSKSFEISQIEGENLDQITIVLSANTTKYFAISQNDINGNVYTQIQKVENSKATSDVQTISIDADTTLGKLKGVVLKDITQTSNAGTSFDLKSISYLYLENSVYKIDFEKQNYSLGIMILKYFHGASLSQFDFGDWLYNFDQSIFDEDTKIKMTKTSDITLENCQIIVCDNQNYLYQNIDLQTLNFDIFKKNDDFSEDVVLTIFDTSASSDNTVLVWHQYMTNQSKTGYLYYTEDNVSKAVSDNIITCQIGSTISNIWDGLISAQIDLNDVYVMSVNNVDYIFRAKSENVQNDMFDAKFILEKFGWTIQTSGTTNMPAKAEITIRKFEQTDWDKIVDTDGNALEQNAYYFAKYNHIQKSLIHFDANLKNQNLCTVLDQDYLIKDVDFEKYTNQLKMDKGYYLISNAEKSAVAYFAQDDILDLCNVSTIDNANINFIEKGFISTSDDVTIKKLATNFELSLSLASASADIKVSCAYAQMIVNKDIIGGKITVEIDAQFLKQMDLSQIDNNTTILFENWDVEKQTAKTGDDAFEQTENFVVSSENVITKIFA